MMSSLSEAKRCGEPNDSVAMRSAIAAARRFKFIVPFSRSTRGSITHHDHVEPALSLSKGRTFLPDSFRWLRWPRVSHGVLRPIRAHGPRWRTVEERPFMAA